MHDSENQLASFETRAFSPQRGGAEQAPRLPWSLPVVKLGRMATKKGDERTRADGQVRKSDGQITRRIGQRVKDLRESVGWSQSELDRRADVAIGTVNRLEAGFSRILGIDTLVRLSEVLQAPLDFLVYGTLQKHQPKPDVDDDLTGPWAMAPGGTRRARLLLTERPENKAVPPPAQAISRPARRTLPTRAKKPGRKGRGGK